MAEPRTYVVARTDVIGFHYWPNAPAHRAYLRTSHRHRFAITVAVGVTDDDREIEIHDLIDLVQLHLADYPTADDTIARQFGAASCEHLARGIGAALTRNWPERHGFVEVLEDGEAGGRIVW